MSRILKAVFGLVFVLLLASLAFLRHSHAANIHRGWSEDDIQDMQRLRLSARGIADKNSANELLYRADAIELGRRLFHDTAMSGSGQVACVTCHRPENGYQDTDHMTFKLDPEAQHRAPGLPGVALQDWFFWDGRADSLWSQALAVIENPKEVASSRLHAVRHLCAQYGKSFPALLKGCQRADLPDAPLHASPLVAEEGWRMLSAAQQENINKLFVLLGKSIAAFEAGLLPPVSPFDLYVDAIAAGKFTAAAAILSEKEAAGLKLFLDMEVGCINCHNGPMFSNSGFFVVATDTPGQPEHDRQRGIEILLDSEFNCLKWGKPEDCPKLLYINKDSAETTGAYKVPSLRNLRHAPAYMHDGHLKNLKEVIEHYQNPPTLPLRHLDIRPTALFPHQREQLLAFLNSLNVDVSRQEIK
jgi:cytochrome c peroxidase